MKTVSILISNYNSYEALQLCVESIRKYTRYPYEIIVYDANSDNKIDRGYLQKAEQAGWLKVILGKEKTQHGVSIELLLDACDTDLAMILDCDIEILAPEWLEDMANLIEDDVVLISNVEKDYNSGVPSLPDWFQSWFMMLNMKAYNDGMKTRWKTSQVNYNGREVFSPTGGKFWLKIQQDNPEGYRMISIPHCIQRKYHHFAHVSILGTLADNEPNLKQLKQAQTMKFNEVKGRLNKLRQL